MEKDCVGEIMKKILFIFILIIILPFTKVQALVEDDISSLLNKTNSLINSQTEMEALNKRYPVGSIYISTTSTNPGTLFGGTWQSFAGGRKLVSTGSNGTTNYTSANQTGGAKTFTLSSSNLPSHTHSLTPSGTVTSSFSGKSVTTSSNGSHTHTVPFGKASSEAAGYGLNTGGTSYVDRILVSSSQGTINTATSTSHSHTLTPSGSVSSSFTGKTVTTSSNGSTSSIDIMNPYATVYMWRRIS